MKLNIIHKKNLNIKKQLELEENLLKKSDENFCFINEGTENAIVLGVSNKEKELIDLDKTKKDKIEIIRRFSGGGTVFVDKDTLFISFIFSKKSLKFSYPEEIFRWVYSFYKKVFKKDNFYLNENDFTFDDKKCCGNAQYIKKDRWLHHSSFLWDFKKQNMDYLHLPKKAPKYRENRSHSEFLIPLKKSFKSKDDFINRIKKALAEEFILSYL